MLDTPEQTHAVGGQVDTLAWEVIGYCTAAGQVEDDRFGFVHLDNQPVQARACQLVGLPASYR